MSKIKTTADADNFDLTEGILNDAQVAAYGEHAPNKIDQPNDFASPGEKAPDGFTASRRAAVRTNAPEEFNNEDELIDYFTDVNRTGDAYMVRAIIDGATTYVKYQRDGNVIKRQASKRTAESYRVTVETESGTEEKIRILDATSEDDAKEKAMKQYNNLKGVISVEKVAFKRTASGDYEVGDIYTDVNGNKYTIKSSTEESSVADEYDEAFFKVEVNQAVFYDGPKVVDMEMSESALDDLGLVRVGSKRTASRYKDWNGREFDVLNGIEDDDTVTVKYVDDGSESNVDARSLANSVKKGDVVKVASKRKASIDNDDERQKYLAYIKHNLVSSPPNEIKNDLRKDGLSEEEISGLFEELRNTVTGAKGIRVGKLKRKASFQVGDLVKNKIGEEGKVVEGDEGDGMVGVDFGGPIELIEVTDLQAWNPSGTENDVDSFTEKGTYGVKSKNAPDPEDAAHSTDVDYIASKRTASMSVGDKITDGNGETFIITGFADNGRVLGTIDGEETEFTEKELYNKVQNGEATRVTGSKRTAAKIEWNSQTIWATQNPDDGSYEFEFGGKEFYLEGDQVYRAIDGSPIGTGKVIEASKRTASFKGQQVVVDAEGFNYVEGLVADEGTIEELMQRNDAAAAQGDSLIDDGMGFGADTQAVIINTEEGDVLVPSEFVRQQVESGTVVGRLFKKADEQPQIGDTLVDAEGRKARVIAFGDDGSVEVEGPDGETYHTWPDGVKIIKHKNVVDASTKRTAKGFGIGDKVECEQGFGVVKDIDFDGDGNSIYTISLEGGGEDDYQEGMLSKAALKRLASDEYDFEVGDRFRDKNDLEWIVIESTDSNDPNADNRIGLMEPLTGTKIYPDADSLEAKISSGEMVRTSAKRTADEAHEKEEMGEEQRIKKDLEEIDEIIDHMFDADSKQVKGVE